MIWTASLAAVESSPIPDIDVRKIGDRLLKTNDLTSRWPDIMAGIGFPRANSLARNLFQPHCI